VPGVNVGITGEPVLDYDEMMQSQKDTTLASIVSMVLCAIIFIYGYNETGRPVKATICLVVGLGYTLAFTTLVVGHLNILTITFVPMLIGLAIDFGVHLITRYEEELHHGKTEEEAHHQGDGVHRPGDFHRRADDGGRVSGDGVDAISRAFRKWASSAAAA
jgi:predicted RND superfamily exporter protein